MANSSAHLYWTRVDGSVERSDIETRPVTVGAHELCTVALADSGAADVHAVVGRAPAGTVVRKLTRTIPLVVAGEEVDERTLNHGDRLIVGNAEVIYLEHMGLAPRLLALTLTREDAEGAVEVQLGNVITRVGREEGDLVIQDGTISSTHMEIENFGDGLMWVRDLGSTNGSELNGETLTDRRPLAIGDTINAGRIVITVGDGGEPPANASDFPTQTVNFPEESMPA